MPAFRLPLASSEAVPVFADRVAGFFGALAATANLFSKLLAMDVMFERA